MDRLVELFVQSARGEGGAPSGAIPGTEDLDEAAISSGLDAVEKLLSSDDAIRMGGSPCATLVLLAMALEEKPKLSIAAIKCYERALPYLARRDGGANSWENVVVLQQLGAVCLRQKHHRDAERWLSECAAVGADATGHPRDANLFGGAFSTPQTRSEFLSMTEKLRAKTCMEIGDQHGFQTHVAEGKRLEAMAKGDAVARQAEIAGGGSSASTSTGGTESPSAVGATSRLNPKQLWAAAPEEERQLKHYNYVDEDTTVLVMLDLNSQLGLAGTEGSDAVESLHQFRVKCEKDVIDVQLRLQHPVSGKVLHFHLLLEPLAKEIVPEDTVPRLRGKDCKRRLELRLFKLNKKEQWVGDLVSLAKPRRDDNSGPTKGTLLNPLSAEELARLPRPSGATDDNRPSSWHKEGAVPAVSLGYPTSRAKVELAAQTATTTSVSVVLEPSATILAGAPLDELD